MTLWDEPSERRSPGLNEGPLVEAIGQRRLHLTSGRRGRAETSAAAAQAAGTRPGPWYNEPTVVISDEGHQRL